MPIVWEKIILYLSGADVVNCMKVNKLLRSAIGQCITSSSKLHQKMDRAATVSAIGRGRFKSTFPVHFSCQKDSAHRRYWKSLRPELKIYGFYAIDDIWFLKKSHSDDLDIHKLSSTHDETRFKKTLRTDESFGDPMVTAFPTPHPNQYIIDDNISATINLLEVGDFSAKIVSSSPVNLSDKVQELTTIEEHHSRPYCIRYKLFIETVGENRYRLSLKLIASNGLFGTSRLLYNVGPEFDAIYPFHTASNEEVRFTAKLIPVLPLFDSLHLL